MPRAMSWTAIIPLKQAGARKTRLTERLTEAERDRLADRLFAHVAGMLMAHPQIGDVLILSPAAPPAGFGIWRRDGGLGLNAELTALRQIYGGRDLLVVHADLPLLGADDITALLAAAGQDGFAIAPDRLGTGTNAITIPRGRPFAFAFGPDSLSAHRAADAGARIVERPGLALDIDTPDDLDAAVAAGFAAA